MGENWSRTPRQQLRRACVESVLDGFKPGTFLELGAGNGDFTAMLLEKGFRGACFDIGAETIRHLNRRFSDQRDLLRVISDFDEISEQKFDYVFAFEVLEHVQNDKETLDAWLRFLGPEGAILLSVPAHQRKYSIDDQIVGHYRRYERTELIQLLEACGIKNVRVLTYGFPLANLSRRVSILLSSREKQQLEKTAQERSIASGITRHRLVNKLGFLANGLLLWPFLKLQSKFYPFDIGDGYVAYGEIE